MAGNISKADVLDLFGEVVDVLTVYADKLDREVELLVRADGTASLMGAEEATVAGEAATGFEEIESFDSMAELWEFLGMAAPETVR